MSKCKPGGCSSIGCEGGFYCFHPDGTPKEITDEQRAGLIAVIAEINAKRDGNNDAPR
jgi:hypothetical protein